MGFESIIGLQHLKNHLKTTVDRNRIPHAQLFVGEDGRGTLPMAIAYAEHLLCHSSKDEDQLKTCTRQIEQLTHPDLHFIFPTNTNKTVKAKARSSDFVEEWRTFVRENPYGSLYDWYRHIGIENKQGKIGIDDAKEITRILSLKSFGGSFKIMVIWHAELLNIQAANYLLKLIEEPPAKTVFLLLTDNEGKILSTLQSRCQKLNFPPLGENDIEASLMADWGCAKEEAQKIAFEAEGNYAKALRILKSNEAEIQYEEWFIEWMRTAFSAAGNKASILKLLSWADEIAQTGRETQKRFLNYCLDFIRQALLQNYRVNSLVYFSPISKNFDLEKFAPFIHSQNIMELTKELELALYHIERNGNSKLILTDLSIKLTRLLHRKEDSEIQLSE